MSKVKGATKSKTILAATAIGILSQVVEHFPLLESVLKDHYQIALFGVSVLFGYLRVITTKPLEEK